jgi:hypothetical protein
MADQDSLTTALPTLSKHIVGPALVLVRQRVVEVLLVLRLSNQLHQAYQMEATTQRRRRPAAESQLQSRNHKAKEELDSRPQVSRVYSAVPSAVIDSRLNTIGRDTKNRFT